MSDERFSFLYDFQVRDQQLATAAQHLTQFNAALERSRLALGAFERTAAAGGGQLHRNLQQSSSSAVDLAAKLSIVGTALRTVSQLAVGAFEQFSRFGDSAISAFGERSGSIRAYTTLLGSRPQAELEFYRAQRFSGQTDFTSSQIEAGQSELITGGFRDQGLYRALFAAGDLGASGPKAKQQERLDAAVRGITKVQAKGYLTLDEVNEELLTAGLSPQVIRQLAKKQYNLKTDEDVEKAFSDKRIRGDDALNLIYNSVLQQLHTTKLGEFSTQSSGSLTGLISNRDEAFKNLLKSFDADEALPAMGRYKAALKEQGATFDINTKAGKNLSLVLQDLSNAQLNARSAWTEFTTSFLESFGESYRGRLEERMKGRDLEWEAARTKDAVQQLGAALGRAGDAFARLAGSADGFVASAARGGSFVLDRDATVLKALGERRPLDAIYESGRGIYDAITGQRDGQLLRSEDPGVGPQRTPHGYITPGDLRAIRDADKATRSRTSSASKKKGRSEAGWSTPIWHYEPAGGGSVTEAAAAINAMIETSGSGSTGAQSIYNQTFNITVPTHPGQSPGEIARAVHLELSTQMRQLSRSPRAGR